MENSFKKLLGGYAKFRDKYAAGDDSIMAKLADHGQQPEIMVLACCDSRVDPAVILRCEPGELFIARNVANIIPPYEADDGHHGTSAALEYGICYLNVKHLVILGHSQCGGINAILHSEDLHQNDFISRWVELIDLSKAHDDPDLAAQQALACSYQNALTFPWIKARVEQQQLAIHRWFFDIKNGEILAYSDTNDHYVKL